jgi:two-component system OmpR family response regulator
VTKPFSVEALVARVRAVLRRVSRSGAGTGEQAGDVPLRAGDLELDESRWTVRRAGVPVELSPTEFRLLAYLLRHQGRVLTRAQLLESVWGWDYAGQSQIVETYVSYLRRKLDPLGPPLIHTQRGVGYTLRAGAVHQADGQGE